MGSLADRNSTDPHWHHKEEKYGVANRIPTAFAIGYMKALVERVEEE